jgi:hypothetical protein
MRIFTPLAVAVLTLSACGGQASFPSGAQGASGAIRTPLLAAKGGAKPSGRLFVSDAGTGDVYLFEVPSLKLFTILTGFTTPQGECSDNKGDVWVTDPGAETIDQLTYAGRVQNRLSDTSGYPDGCAWDPTNGNLAVMNLFSGSDPGAVLIYHHASGIPNKYTNPKQFFYDFGGYDGEGNLFFDGSDTQGKFMLSELHADAASAKTIAITGGKIYDPGMVQWEGGSSYLNVGDQKCGNETISCLYQLTVSGKTATIENQIHLRNYVGGQVCDMVQGVIAFGELFGSDNDYCGSLPSTTYSWHYPAGGSPNYLNKKTDSMPFGAAIGTNGTNDSARGRSGLAKAPWMDIGAKKLDLLYITDGNGEVTVYTYWQKTLVGELTNFEKPMGECVDKSDDVYITDASAQQIVEYAHAGKKPLRTIDDSPYVPYACSVDFTTDNLAVANESGGSNGKGNIAVYQNATGAPKLYTDSALSNFEGCVYDNQGNLLVTNGEADSELSSFAWLPKGADKLVTISIPGPEKNWTWRDVTGLQWDGRYFVLDDYALYRITISNGAAYYVGQTDITEEGVYGPFWIYNDNPKKQGTQFVSAYNEEDAYGGVEYFNYPAGGDSIAQISKGIEAPYGVTVSLGKIHE